MRRFLMLALVAALAVALFPTGAAAQISFNENHYLCYPIDEFVNHVPAQVQLVDQFGQYGTSTVRPRYLCNPVRKNNESPVEPQIHQLCYELGPVPVASAHWAVVDNQFTEPPNLQVRVIAPELLCVPSRKIELD